jgi:hypothetical protein
MSDILGKILATKAGYRHETRAAAAMAAGAMPPPGSRRIRTRWQRPGGDYRNQEIAQRGVIRADFQPGHAGLRAGGAACLAIHRHSISGE